MPVLGQRLSNTNPRYIKHPPASSPVLSNGKPLDAGTAQIIDNNLTILDWENLEHLGSCVGFSNAQAATQNNNAWAGIADAPVPADPSAEQPWNQISWDRRCSVRQGPYFMKVDKALSDGRLTIRDVVVHFGWYNHSGTNLKMMFFLTPYESPPRDGWLAYTTHSDTASGYQQTRQVIQCDRGLIESQGITSTATGEVVTVCQVYLWVGWILNNDNSDWRFIDSFTTR